MSEFAQMLQASRQRRGVATPEAVVEVRSIFCTEIAGFTIEMAKSSNYSKRFCVTYGAQVRDCLTYAAAATELGQCILHASALEGLM